MTGEFELLAAWRDRFPLIGDDAAVVPPPDGPLLLAADAVVGGVHFDDGWRAFDVGRKAVAVNLSDLAAMGARPLHLLVTVAAPPGTDLDGLVDGVASEADAWACEVAGGDLTATAGPLVVSVAVTGTIDDGGPGPVLRSGARRDDVVYVTGPLGGAAAAGWRRVPSPRLGEGARARHEGATAMIDVSDGLASELQHLADESAVGISLDDVPLATGASLDQALHGGEDFELLFTGPAGMTGTAIGRCTDEAHAVDLRGVLLEGRGWEHRW